MSGLRVLASEKDWRENTTITQASKRGSWR